MINRCNKCEQILRNGDTVRVLVKATYHELKSKIAFAIGKDIQDAYADTLEHVDCRQEAP